MNSGAVGSATSIFQMRNYCYYARNYDGGDKNENENENDDKAQVRSEVICPELTIDHSHVNPLYDGRADSRCARRAPSPNRHTPAHRRLSTLSLGLCLALCPL